MNQTGTEQKPEAEQPLTGEERAFIEALQRYEKRELTQQEINLALAQAKLLGML